MFEQTGNSEQSISPHLHTMDIRGEELYYALNQLLTQKEISAETTSGHTKLRAHKFSQRLSTYLKSIAPDQIPNLSSFNLINNLPPDLRLDLGDANTIDEFLATYEKTTVDELTHLSNRRAFNRQIQTIIGQMLQSADFTSERRQGGADELRIALVMFDIDDFKFVNDHYGHPMGDKVIQFVASKLVSVFRDGVNSVFRWGGEEFTAIMKLKMTSSNQEVYNSIDYKRQKIGTYQHSDGQKFTPQLSAGAIIFSQTDIITLYMSYCEQKEIQQKYDEQLLPEFVDIIVKMVDDLEISAKKSGKNKLCTPPQPAGSR